jgi:uncharacterized LabA/DUF88 family protein
LEHHKNMPKPKIQKTIVMVDGANLHRGIKSQNWTLDYAKFAVWLKDKYHVSTIYLFIGLIPSNKELYTKLNESGYTLVFKETTYDINGQVKGNCDADLVLNTVVKYYEKQYDKIIIVTSDGDFASLAKFLIEKNVLTTLISPSMPRKNSILLKRICPSIVYLTDLKSKLALKRKNPR